MGFLMKMKAKSEDLNGFLKENKIKSGGFPPIGGRRKECNHVMRVSNCLSNHRIIVRARSRIKGGGRL